MSRDTAPAFNDAIPPADDAALVARMREGDESAYEEAVRLYGSQLLAVAKRFLGQEQDAQDAVQEGFVRAFENLDSFAGQARFSTWLYKIVVNNALMKLRSRRRKPEQSIDDLLPRFSTDGRMADSFQEWAVTHDSAVADREMREAVQASIARLPDSYRSVLLLRDIEGQSTEETAELLGVTPGAVKTRLHRARQALRTLLHPYMSGAPS
ncbi:RNA polymerase sigma factor [Lignipirellula cremea]|uniref:ECF RNA polymerase sigma factor SigW n=1 Tax=Lignipirellula cremea TaxID=2528010 RepID=A0A518DUK5_9BACT|nr:sigma-70 family RNA polymerase sigma factor [Lignipirellula cremea]QDU95508.1 ECF RNA polymerase sigma factor SigW [Lignipirellula cremea]